MYYLCLWFINFFKNVCDWVWWWLSTIWSIYLVWFYYFYTIADVCLIVVFYLLFYCIVHYLCLYLINFFKKVTECVWWQLFVAQLIYFTQLFGNYLRHFQNKIINMVVRTIYISFICIKRRGKLNDSDKKDALLVFIFWILFVIGFLLLLVVVWVIYCFLYTE